MSEIDSGDVERRLESELSQALSGIQPTSEMPTSLRRRIRNRRLRGYAGRGAILGGIVLIVAVAVANVRTTSSSTQMDPATPPDVQSTDEPLLIEDFFGTPRQGLLLTAILGHDEDVRAIECMHEYGYPDYTPATPSKLVTEANLEELAFFGPTGFSLYHAPDPELAGLHAARLDRNVGPVGGPAAAALGAAVDAASDRPQEQRDAAVACLNFPGPSTSVQPLVFDVVSQEFLDQFMSGIDEKVVADLATEFDTYSECLGPELTDMVMAVDREERGYTVAEGPPDDPGHNPFEWGENIGMAMSRLTQRSGAPPDVDARIEIAEREAGCRVPLVNAARAARTSYEQELAPQFEADLETARAYWIDIEAQYAALPPK